MSETEVLNIVKDLIECLSFLERKEIVHGGICPSNILLNGESIVLSGFGSCSLKNINNWTEKPKTIYDCPEFNENREMSYKSDIWSLGITAVELITGENPFINKKYGEVLQSIENLQLFSPLETSLDFKLMLQKMLRISPSQRFSP